MKDLVTISQRLIMVGQFGLSLLMPLLMCLGGCYLLISKLGLGGGFMTAYKFWLAVNRREKEKEKDPPAFNLHQ